MRGLGFQKDLKFSWKSIYPMLISCIFVIISQLSLTLIPHSFSSSPLLLQLCFSVALLLIITVLCRIPKRLLKIYASAPAFVFFNIFFMWIVHNLVIRTSVSLVTTIVLNAECALLLFGFHSILYSDPGWVINEDSTSDQLLETEVIGTAYLEEEEVLRTENSFPTMRVRYCKRCKAYIKGFDHHCPAFGNCIGQNNHLLFMVLLVGFITLEASYIVCSNQCMEDITKSKVTGRPMLESTLSGKLVISTMLFSLLQVLWKVIFFIWHIYCACVNIKTDEWINWRKYPEFQLFHPQAGQSYPEIGFINPYDKGVLANIKEILSPRT
ncbi:probable protein S-acyltransferase 15 isoform X1 [Papaver somniferum]|uniref:probable protein S-acyltransferase 15 isoform X1 n=1 Tax=Papaver somniferum TaxID=3469 RepID=UPI000E6F824D|nr:probable protein S-acyltransferase 15 isoform X1 [Papaver somniferum]